MPRCKRRLALRRHPQHHADVDGVGPRAVREADPGRPLPLPRRADSQRRRQAARWRRPRRPGAPHGGGRGPGGVSIVLAARGELADFAHVRSAEQVRAWLETLNYVDAKRLVACEVVWSPQADKDRMSSIELEAVYPEMKKIRRDVRTGRAQCSYCHGFFPGELVTCPHCGAPTTGEAAA